MLLAHKHRIEYIDTIRGFAMLLVVLGHAFFYNGGKNSILCGAIYSFHMPLFFAISGFCAAITYHPDGIKDMCRVIGNKCLSILYPYLVWGLFIHPCCEEGFITHIKNLISLDYWLHFSITSDYWFLPCLFILSMFFMCYKQVSNYKPVRGKKNIVTIVFVLSSLGLLALFFHFFHYSIFKHCLSFIIPYFVGASIATSNINELIGCKTRYYTIVFVFFAFMIIYVLADKGSLFSQISRLFCGTLSILVLFPLFGQIKCKFINKHLSAIGKFTLGIYLIHFCILRALPLPINAFGCQILFNVLLFVTLLYISLVLSWLINYSRITRLVLLGKNKK